VPYKNKEDLYLAQKRHRIRIRRAVYEYLRTRCCVDCGEKDPIVLEFDHDGKSGKFKTINKMLSGHYSWKSVLNEINKCDVRCANCHRRKTYRELETFKIKMPL